MTDSTDTRKKEFTIVRVFEAPRSALWKAWTDAEEASHWMHPRGMTTPREDVSFDVRQGGTYRYTMVDDNTGEKYPTGGTYLEVVEPTRLVFTWGDPDDAIEEAMVITISLEEEGEGSDRTKLTLNLVGADGQPGDGFIYDGWESALDSLGDHAER